jgi:hypothetical protein
MSENEQIMQFLKKHHPSAPIIEVHGPYIILAQDEQDLKSKKGSIDRGNILGFYIKERIISLMRTTKDNTKPNV